MLLRQLFNGFGELAAIFAKGLGVGGVAAYLFNDVSRDGEKLARGVVWLIFRQVVEDAEVFVILDVVADHDEAEGGAVIGVVEHAVAVAVNAVVKGLVFVPNGSPVEGTGDLVIPVVPELDAGVGGRGR